MKERVWRIHQNPWGKFVLTRLDGKPVRYLGQDVNVGVTTTGEFSSIYEAESALERLLRPERYAKYYDAEGNDIE